MREFIPILKDKVSGKRGGSASLIEIVTSEHDKIEEALLLVEEAMAQE